MIWGNGISNNLNGTPELTRLFAQDHWNETVGHQGPTDGNGCHRGWDGVRHCH